MTDLNPKVREALNALEDAHRELFDRGRDPMPAESALLAAVRADVLTGTHEGPWRYKAIDSGEWQVYALGNTASNDRRINLDGDATEPEARAVCSVLNLLARKEAP